MNMNNKIKEQRLKQKQTRPHSSVDANKEKQKAEAREVAGRHKNDGAKDHKGAR